MSTSEKKAGISATISKELKEKAEKIAKEQERSFSFLVAVALKEYVAKYEETKKAPAE